MLNTLQGRKGDDDGMTTKINGRTPEEIKKLLANHKSFTFSAEQLFADALAYIQQLEAAQPKWISVEERLPDEIARVLVYIDGYYTVSELHNLWGGMVWDYMGIDGRPTHWMPLPEPPKVV